MDIYTFFDYDKHSYIILTSELNDIQKMNVKFLLILSKNSVNKIAIKMLKIVGKCV